MKSQRPDPFPEGLDLPEEWKAFRMRRTQRVAEKRARSVVIDALDQTLDFKQARRVQFCGFLWREWKHLLPSGEQVISWRQLTCRSRYCPYCSNVWTAEVINRLETAPEVYTQLMFTLTVPNSNSYNLRDRVKDLLAVWKVFRDRMRRKDGLLGGIYSLEITMKKTETGSWYYHPHLHVLARFENHGWLESDKLYLENYTPRSGSITPAYLHVLERWTAAMSKARPKLFDRLPNIESVLPNGVEAALWLVDHQYNLVMPEKWAAVDVSGRSPLLKPGQEPEPLCVLEGTLVDAREILKYALKELVDPPAGEGDPVDDAMGMSFVVGALWKRRRAQPFGDCYRLKIPDPEEMEDPEESVYTELKNYPNGWTGRVSVWCGMVQGDFWGAALSAFCWRVRDGTGGRRIGKNDEGWALFDTGLSERLEEWDAD